MAALDPSGGTIVSTMEDVTLHHTIEAKVEDLIITYAQEPGDEARQYLTTIFGEK